MRWIALPLAACLASCNLVTGSFESSEFAGDWQMVEFQLFDPMVKICAKVTLDLKGDNSLAGQAQLNTFTFNDVTKKGTCGGLGKPPVTLSGTWSAPSKDKATLSIQCLSGNCPTFPTLTCVIVANRMSCTQPNNLTLVFDTAQ
jgi:hypothetical protein